MIQESYRNLLSGRMAIATLEYELRAANSKIAMLELNLQDMIGKTALTFSAIEDSKIRPESVIAGGDDFTNEMRQTLTSNAKLIKYVLATDNMADADNPETKQLTIESLKNAENSKVTQSMDNAKQSPSKSERKKRSESVSRRRKKDRTMDAE